MLPFVLQKLRLSKSSLTQTASAIRQFKITKVFRPLAVSSYAAIQKPKAIASKKSPMKKLQKKRLAEKLKKLAIHWQEQLEPKPEPAKPASKRNSRNRPKSARKQNRPSRFSLLLDQLKSVVKAKVKKVEKKTERRQEKRMFLKRLRQVVPFEEMHNSTVAAKFGCLPIDTPISSAFEQPRCFISKNGKLKGLESRFAYPGFNASKMKPLTTDDPEKYKASMEAHLEMQNEIALASDPNIDDTLVAPAPRPLEASMVTEYPSAMEVDVNDIEMELDERPLVGDVEMVDVVAHAQVPSITTPSVYAHAVLHGQPSFPKQAQIEDINMLDIVPSAASASASTSTLHSTSGHAHNSHFQYPPKKSSGLRNVMYADPASSSFTPSSHKSSPPKQPPAAPSKATNTFNIAALPLPNSSRGCQRKSNAPTVEQNTKAAGAIVTIKALAPPPGARRATPVNLIKIV